MKTLFAITALFLLSIISGCIVEYNPHSEFIADNPYRSFAWTASGNSFFAVYDSLYNYSSYKIRSYDKNGSLLQSFIQPEGSPSSLSTICGTNDDSSFYYSSYSGNSNYQINRYQPSTGINTPIAGGSIFGESLDRNHLFIGPYSSSTSSLANNFLILDVSGKETRLQNAWHDEAVTSYISNGTWMGTNTVGYFRYNDLNLIDFVVRDTNGKKLDSFNIPVGRYYSSKIFYGAAHLYIVTSDSIVQFDSLTRTSKTLVKDNISSSTIASDGSFIVYSTGNSYSDGGLYVMNTKTGTIKKIADHSVERIAIAPTNDRVVYVDHSDSKAYKILVIPVSAP